MFISFPWLLYTAIALSSSTFADTTNSLILCTTFLGAKPVTPVPSKTYALTVTSKATLTTTFTPSLTITPLATTDTVSTTTTFTSITTAQQGTVTFSTTTTATVVVVVTQTRIIGVTTYTTTTSTFSGTTTVPTSPGFTPATSGTSTALAKRIPRAYLDERALNYKVTCTAGPDGRPTFSPALYPTSVLCGGIVKVITTVTRSFTASTTATVTGPTPPPSTITTLVSATETSTEVPPDVQTTTTFTVTRFSTSTVLVSITTTSTLTRTQVLQSPVATYYAACGPENQLSNVGGENISGLRTGNTLTLLSKPSTYDCCVECLTSPSCGASTFFSNRNQCILVGNAGVCDPKIAVLDYFTSATAPRQNFVSTSNCGGIRRVAQ